ncbi:nuclear transport factor 2 family protein [Flavobacteriaceae bacterium AU392]|nr:nuclear transport factor 2 family protein [Flavobacteriaceae bacterium]RKM85543.1 nuclear transport factor 2 family protein [Flavobacteriaceae bacterium AU392]
MSKSPKSIVRSFYNLDISTDGIESYKSFLHKDCELNWNSSKGYTKLLFDDIIALFNDIETSYESVRFQISHLLEDGAFVTTRYTLYVTPIEDTDNETALAHFITIWEVKDGKLYKGFEISQTADESLHSLNSYSEINI